jgi:hypothetical protein
MARALSSTSFPKSPTATSVSFTTATYLPAYLEAIRKQRLAKQYIC